MLARERVAPPLAAVVIAALAALPTPRVAIRLAGATAQAHVLAADTWTDHDLVLAAPSLAWLGDPYQILDADIDASAAAERRRLAHRTGTTFCAEYRDQDEIDRHMTELAAAHPGLVTVRELGRSAEGRAIRALEISRGATAAVVLNGGQHAREWLSVMVPICLADRLIAEHADDPILAQLRFVIVPVVNPDGYHYAWTTDRYWRKSRRGGHGVDLNRNFPVGWGGAGSSGDPQSPNYRGDEPFSEPETRALRDLFASEHVAAHVDFHSYSQVIVYPWSHTRDEPPDRDRYAAIADRISSAMAASGGKRYAIRPGSELTIGAGGTAADWSYGEHRSLAFLVELRPASRSDGGFVLPPDQIVAARDEALAGVLALAAAVRP